MTFLNQGGSLSYIVKVKAKTTQKRTYLFGSSKISNRFDGKLILLMRVDPEGEPIRIWAKADTINDPYEVCELASGEIFVIALDKVNGVYAEEPEADTRVHCALVSADAR